MPSKYTASSRVISEDIISDKRVASLESFVGITAHFRIILRMDNLGRIEADPEVLRPMIFPRNSSISLKKVAEISQALHDAGLYFWYEANGERYMQSPSYQRQKMVGHMKRASALPPPNPKEFLAWLLDIRKDKRFIGVEYDTCLEQVNTMLSTGLEHVTPEQSKSKNRVRTELELETEDEDESVGVVGDPTEIERITRVAIDNLEEVTVKNELEIKRLGLAYGTEPIEYAILQACLRNIRTWPYCVGVLKNLDYK